MNYKNIFITALVILNISTGFTQQEKKESNNDFRNNDEMFSLRELSNSKNNIMLMRNNQQEFVVLYGEGDSQARLRLDSQKMREVDTEFVQKFFQITYVLGSNEGKCDELYQLSLRGEKSKVCASETAKIDEVKKLLSYFIGLKK